MFLLELLLLKGEELILQQIALSFIHLLHLVDIFDLSQLQVLEDLFTLFLLLYLVARHITEVMTEKFNLGFEFGL